MSDVEVASGVTDAQVAAEVTSPETMNLGPAEGHLLEDDMGAQKIAVDAKQVASVSEKLQSAMDALKGLGNMVAPAAPKRHYGQSAGPIEVAYTDLNKNEKKVLGCFEAKGHRKAHHLKELAAAAFPSKKAVQANSWVRNSMRRLVRGGLVENLSLGQYRVTDTGRAMLKAALKAD